MPPIDASFSTVQTVSVHGRSVSYLEAGEGPLLLLVHGMAGTARNWDPVIEPLALHNTVVAADFPGHGASEPGGGDYSLGSLASGLRDLMVALGHERATLVGHSLGGLVALEATRGVRGLPKGRIVSLGSPLRGSAVARGLASVPGGRLLLGHSAEPLLDGLDAWKSTRPVGVIAGRLPFGLGVSIGALSAPHDGTVSVSETRLPGIADHVTVDASHTGLLFSGEVAELTVAFLRDAHFSQSRGGNARQ